MSTLPIRAPYMPQVRAANVRTIELRPFAGFARVVSFFSALIDVFVEAQEMAGAAYKRYGLLEE